MLVARLLVKRTKGAVESREAKDKSSGDEGERVQYSNSRIAWGGDGTPGEVRVAFVRMYYCMCTRASSCSGV